MRRAKKTRRFMKSRIILFVLASVLILTGTQVFSYAQETVGLSVEQNLPFPENLEEIPEETVSPPSEEELNEEPIQPPIISAEPEEAEEAPKETEPPSQEGPLESIEKQTVTETIAPQEMVQEEEVSIAPLAIITAGLDPNEVMVDNFADLKTVLENYSTYAGVDTIYLNGDITYATGGIQINAARTNITIIGHPKGESGQHTITDLAGGVAGNTIRILKNSFNLTVKDVNINGKNYYGPFMVYDGYIGCTISYENVTYTGPQITYNWQGLTRYIDTTVTIMSNGGDPAQEVGEVAQVEMGGNTTFAKNQGDVSMFWFRGNPGSNQYLKVLDGANVSINNTSTVSAVYGILYVEGAGVGTNQKPVVTIGTGATLSAVTRNGFLSYDHRVESVTVNQGATLRIEQTGTGAGYPTLNINSLLQINDGATFEVQRSTNTFSTGLVRFYGGAQMELNNPLRVKLYNPNTTYKRVISAFSGTVTISGMVGAINAWNTDNGYTDDINNMSTNIWNKNDSASMSMSATLGTTSVTSASISNKAPEDPFTAEFNSTTFNTYAMPMLVMGSYYLDTDAIYPNNTDITGLATSNAEIKVSYTNGGIPQTLTTTADSGGVYAVAVTDSPIAQGTEILVMSHKNYLKARHNTTVLEQPSILRFASVPEELSFITGQISALPQTVGRQNTSWTMSVEDTRGSGSMWRIDASIAQPLSGTDGSNQYTLPGALVYVDGTGTYHALGSAPITIHNGTTGSVPQTDISWVVNRGMLVSLSGGEGQSNVPYTTTIEWSLVDAP